MKIYLIRHGESTSDIENRYGGDYDDPLTETGHQQAEDLAVTLHDKGIQTIFTSPRIRAQETAAELQQVLDCTVSPVADLRERNFYGVLTGMNKEEARTKHPELVALLEDRHNTLPQGEPYSQFADRVQKAWETITASSYETVAVVTHAGPIRCIFRDILGKGELSSIGDCAYFEITL